MESNQNISITMDYKVLVGCMTYNHSKYIVDALNGFAMQQTNFPFACIVIDDASTDGEPEVIKDWLQNECDMERADFYDLELANVFIVPHQTNANCTMAVYFLKRNLYNEGNLKFDLVKDWGSHCEYLALCEGDDYWTDPEKLQIQSDCLDTHPEVDMCAHNYREVSAVSGYTIKKICRRNCDCIVSVSDIVKGGGDYLATDSICYRICIESNIPTFRQYLNYDYSLFVHGALRGGIYYICREMSVYRTSVPNSWDSYMNSDKVAYEHFVDQFIQMLKYFSDEGINRNDIRYIRSVTLASALQQLVYSRNSKRENIRVFRKYKYGFRSLPIMDRINTIGKCLFPSIGKRAKRLFANFFVS